MPGPVGGLEPVRVEGLAQFQAALRNADRALSRELGQVNKRAAELVATGARSKASGLGGVAAHAAPSIKAAAEQRRSKITIGGPQHPEALGAEFGGKRRPTTQQFEPWRGSGAGAGYFLYPTIRDTADEWIRLYERALDQLFHDAFPS